jgi:hypothetical protein
MKITVSERCFLGELIGEENIVSTSVSGLLAAKNMRVRE